MSGASLSHVSGGASARTFATALPWESVLAAVGATLAVGGLAAANGGYFPPSWGWSAIAFAWVLGLALVLRRTVTLAKFDVAVIGAWATYTAWTWLSILWSSAAWRSVLEGERALVYVTAVAAALLVVSRASASALLGGVLAASTLISGYALLTRIVPDRIGVFDPVSGYRLATPVGYWNGLGILAVIGTLLAVGFAARARTVWARALAAVLPVVLVPTLYFTFSRGAWVALIVGLLAAFVVAPARLQYASALIFAIPGPLIVVAVAARSDALTHSASQLGAAAHDGHRLLLVVVVLAVANAALAVVRTYLERVEYARELRWAYASVLVAVPLAFVLAVVVHYGGPGALAHKAYSSFKAPPASDTTNLNSRLFALTSNGRVDAWHVAVQQWHHHPLVGDGAGTYEPYWYQHRPSSLNLRDAHDLYVETLAELGVVGLVLIALGFGLPLVAAFRARAHPLVPAAFAGLVAYVVHAAVDWDWELSAITLAALLCGVALVAAARRGEPAPLRLPFRVGGVAVTAAIAAMALVGVVSNQAIAKSGDAIAAGRYVAAAKAAKHARSWAPWSPQPWQRLGDAAYGAGYTDAARVAYEHALAKDPTQWLVWFDLAAVTTGAERKHAAAEAVRLNPFAGR